LLIRCPQQVEIADDLIGFRALARVCLDRRDKVGGAAVMKEEHALAEPPERSGAELLAVGPALADLVLQARPHVVKSDVAKGRDRHVALAAEWRLRRRVLGDVAAAATDIDELVGALDRRIGRRGWRGRGQQTHEGREIDDVGGEIRRWTRGRLGHGEIRRVLRRGVEPASLRIIPLVGKCLAGDALLDIVGLAREDQQRLVLCLPSKSRDCAVIAAGVELSRRDAEGRLWTRDIGRVGLKISVWNILNQSGSERRCRNAEDDVVLRDRLGEIRLRDIAAHSVGAVCDHEDIVHAAIRCPVWIFDEARLRSR
jgi:hypothetical protein